MKDLKTKGRGTLLLVATAFLGPFLLALFLYNSDSSLIPGGSTEHGILIIPPRELPELSLAVNSDGSETTTPSLLRVKWSMLHIGPGECGDQCQVSLLQTRQVRRALGKEMGRIDRIFLITKGKPDEAALNRNHPGLIIVDLKLPGGQELLQTVGKIAPGDVFLVDPHGNLMMRYPADTGMKGMHKDLKRLLKLSQIG